MVVASQEEMSYYQSILNSHVYLQAFFTFAQLEWEFQNLDLGLETPAVLSTILKLVEGEFENEKLRPPTSDQIILTPGIPSSASTASKATQTCSPRSPLRSRIGLSLLFRKLRQQVHHMDVQNDVAFRFFISFFCPWQRKRHRGK